MKVITSQRLLDGIVVFKTAAGWSERIDEAQVFEGENAEALLARAKPDEDRNHVTGTYLIDVRREGDAVVPTRYRERIRALGPTVRPDLQRTGSYTL